MPVAYLQDSEFATYGIPSATDAQVAQASRIIDGYLARPKGIVWAPDANGAPAYMANASAEMTWASSAAIAAGQNVVVSVVGQMLYTDLVGRTVMLEAGVSGVGEACVISSVNPAGKTITLASVQFNHAASIPIQSGLQIFEERSVPSGRSISRVGQWPVAGILSAQGRYDYGRRSDQMTGDYQDFELLTIMQEVGGPPAFVPLDVTQVGVNPVTGELWLPAGQLLGFFNTARVYYVAGWQQSAIPTQIKQACANIAGAAASGLLGNTALKSVSMVGIAISRFANSTLDADTKAMLDPYKARLLG